jgi:phage shock protein PspC (stress-responsive transcriptional regulator)
MEQEQTTAESGDAGSRDTNASAMWDRPVEGRILGGVAVGIAERLRVAPWLIRVLFGIALIPNGAGLLLYFALWLLMPERSTGKAMVDGMDLRIGRVDSPARVAGLVIIVLGVAMLLGAANVFSSPLVLAVALAGVGIALINSRN